VSKGRGFAVVAGEVRSLAQRSAQAAKEIEGLIKESVQRVTTGSEMANKAGTTMEQIVSSVTNVSGIMNEIPAPRKSRAGVSIRLAKRHGTGFHHPAERRWFRSRLRRHYH
jgi:methyl-accepting chemotaxis protein